MLEILKGRSPLYVDKKGRPYFYKYTPKSVFIYFACLLAGLTFIGISFKIFLERRDGYAIIIIACIASIGIIAMALSKGMAYKHATTEYLD